MSLFVLLFLAGMITILLPCILPLVPVVVGVSIAGRSRFRPFVTVLGMVISFTLFTFVLLVVLDQFVELADYIRIATYYILLLFGVSFLSGFRVVRLAGAVAGGFFFLDKGVPAVVIAIMLGIFALEIAGSIANRIQQFGAGAQLTARSEFGNDSLLTAFLVGLTLGLVWVPCAGPALGFALALVREQPGPMALLALFSYALGTAVPLLIVGYGGQYAVRSVRVLNKYTGLVKRIVGIILILTAVALHMNVLQKIQVWVEDHTMFGDVGSKLEELLFPIDGGPSGSGAVSSSNGMQPSSLPKIIRAPELTGLGPWHNSEPLTMAGMKDKVVLVDFWTYSCINCIRTLPYVQGYWDKYKGTEKFVLLGVHTPEFTFEKSEKNVAMAIKEHGLTYPVAQDNDFGTWSAFANRYWPAKYLIDAQGYVRYTHFGEGDYEETDKAIASLLAEIGVSSTGAVVTESSAPREGGPITPETYLSSRSWPAFGNAQGEPGSAILTYAAPSSVEPGKYYLSGSWQLVDDESETLRSDTGEIRMKFVGGEINLVLGMEDGAKPVKAEVMVDGKDAGTFIVDRHDLFNLFKGDYGEHDVILKLTGKGVQAFAFTFGR